MDKRTGHISGFHPDSPEVSPTLKAVQAYSINPKDTQIMSGPTKNNKMLKSNICWIRVGIFEYKKSILMCPLFRVTNAMPRAKCAPVNI